MKTLLPVLMIGFGILLILYSSIVFFLLSSSSDPVILPFVAEPILGSLGCIILGIAFASGGFFWRRAQRAGGKLK